MHTRASHETYNMRILNHTQVAWVLGTSLRLHAYQHAHCDTYTCAHIPISQNVVAVNLVIIA